MTPGIYKYLCHERYYSLWYSEYRVCFYRLSNMIVTNSPAQQIDTITSDSTLSKHHNQQLHK